MDFWELGLRIVGANFRSPALQDEDIVQRDIKPANVFVQQDDQLVLGDFAMAFLAISRFVTPEPTRA